jgi:hypothetical protein
LAITFLVFLGVPIFRCGQGPVELESSLAGISSISIEA